MRLAPALHRFGRVLHDPAVPPRRQLTKEQYADPGAAAQQTTLNHFDEKLLLLKVPAPAACLALCAPAARTRQQQQQWEGRMCRPASHPRLPARCAPLQDLMLTEAGRRLAEGRHAFMEAFLQVRRPASVAQCQCACRRPAQAPPPHPAPCHSACSAFTRSGRRRPEGAGNFSESQRLAALKGVSSAGV